MFLLDSKFPLVFDEEDGLTRLTPSAPPTAQQPAPGGDAATEDGGDDVPAFSGALETNVTASLGQTAFLRCRLRNGQHQVRFTNRIHN